MLSVMVVMLFPHASQNDGSVGALTGNGNAVDDVVDEKWTDWWTGSRWTVESGSIGWTVKRKGSICSYEE
jgi:hypothetical protein